MISILPSRDDKVVASGSEVAGGPAGSRVLLAVTWWNAFRVLVVMTAVAAVAGYLSKYYCLTNGWGDGRYTHMCYSDIPALYELRGLADGAIPYLSDLPADQVLEYPALTGLFVWVAARLTPAGDAHWYFDVNVLLLLVCWLVAVLATAVSQRSRPWDAAMVALAPGIILAGTVNWDLLPVALVAVSFALWSHERPFWAGVFLGLGIAAKFYPLLILGPIFLLCWRARAWAAFTRYALGAVSAWLVVNVPLMLLNFGNWARFYTFSRERGQDFGSIWLALETAGRQIPPERLNTAATGLLLLAALALAVLIWRAPVVPRVGQVTFLIVAAFLVTNKVYSPQYVVWLIPLAVLARPRWRDLLIWQGAEVVYFVAIWLYLAGLEGDDAKGLSEQAYAVAIVIHVVATLWLAGLVVRDILRPDHDPIRTDGAGVMDPLAGPLAPGAATGSPMPAVVPPAVTPPAG
ncbi:MAG: glycosyltransferase 87 family protein [Candidatus Nanopelagicales bacterium]